MYVSSYIIRRSDRRDGFYIKTESEISELMFGESRRRASSSSSQKFHLNRFCLTQNSLGPESFIFLQNKNKVLFVTFKYKTQCLTNLIPNIQYKETTLNIQENNSKHTINVNSNLYSDRDIIFCILGQKKRSFRPSLR